MLGITYIMLYYLLNKFPLCISCNKMKAEKISMSQLLCGSSGVSCFCCELRDTLWHLTFALVGSGSGVFEASWAASCQLLSSPLLHTISLMSWESLHRDVISGLLGIMCDLYKAGSISRIKMKSPGSPWEQQPLSRDTELFRHQPPGVLVPLTPLSWPPWLVVLFLHAPTCLCTPGHSPLVSSIVKWRCFIKKWCLHHRREARWLCDYIWLCVEFQISYLPLDLKYYINWASTFTSEDFFLLKLFENGCLICPFPPSFLPSPRFVSIL